VKFDENKLLLGYYLISLFPVPLRTHGFISTAIARYFLKVCRKRVKFSSSSFGRNSNVIRACDNRFNAKNA